MTVDEVQARLADDVVLTKDEQRELMDAIEQLDDPERAFLLEALIVRYPGAFDL